MLYWLRATSPWVSFSLFGLMIVGCAEKLPGVDRTEGAAPDAMQGAGAETAASETKDVYLAMSADAAPNQVTIDNFKFSPRELTVSVGTTVTWINRDDVPHTATSLAKPRLFDSGTLDTDDKFSHVFASPGVYEYFCAVHPHMKAKIIVK